MKKFKMITLTAFLSLSILGACQNNPSKTDSGGNNNNIAPSAGDETRYNLSEQQEMSMQGDTIKVDSTQKDSIK